MSSLLDHTHFYLVGIKGVAMTAIAQCLLDAGKSVLGSDVPEDFVTQHILDQQYDVERQERWGSVTVSTNRGKRSVIQDWSNDWLTNSQ